ncbi:hypothetical protein TNCV_3748131 [Trichonephila clavipes]|nr:hypothetical protein TNCV_3748131 [Trichonephila clavipes]
MKRNRRLTRVDVLAAVSSKGADVSSSLASVANLSEVVGNRRVLVDNDLVVESTVLDIGIDDSGSDMVASIEEGDGKRCASVEDDDMEVAGVASDIFGFGRDENG